MRGVWGLEFGVEGIWVQLLEVYDFGRLLKSAQGSEVRVRQMSEGNRHAEVVCHGAQPGAVGESQFRAPPRDVPGSRF